MGRFDGILIATDLDGTLANKFEFNKKDLDAIEYFKSEGGLFTLATGRAYVYVRENIIPIVRPNAPVITLNGAVISDSPCEKILHRSYLENYQERFLTVNQFSEYINEIYVYYENCIGPEVIRNDKLHMGLEAIDINRRLHKIVFAFKDEEKAKEAILKADKYSEFDGNVCLRSWPTGLELLSSASTKDKAVLRVKEMTGSKTLVCAGDFENDIPMLKCADIGYAVGNAIPSVKQVADRISPPQSESAIAYIINEINVLL